MKQGKRKCFNCLNGCLQPGGDHFRMSISGIHLLSIRSKSHFVAITRNCYHLPGQPKGLWNTVFRDHGSQGLFKRLSKSSHLRIALVFLCSIILCFIVMLCFQNTCLKPCIKVSLSLDEDVFSHTFVLFKYLLLTHIKVCMDIIETPFKSYPSIYCQSHEPDQCIICALKLYWQHFYVLLLGTSLAHVDNPI